MIFIDANIVMYAVGRPHRYKEACARIIVDISEGKIPAVTDCEILQEILYRYWYIRELEKGLQVFEDFQNLVPKIFPIGREDLIESAQILRENFPVSPRDALHVAVMRNNGVNSILSTDTHFDLIPRIQRKDPLTMSDESV